VSTGAGSFSALLIVPLAAHSRHKRPKMRSRSQAKRIAVRQRKALRSQAFSADRQGTSPAPHQLDKPRGVERSQVSARVEVQRHRSSPASCGERLHRRFEQWKGSPPDRECGGKPFHASSACCKQGGRHPDRGQRQPIRGYGNRPPEGGARQGHQAEAPRLDSRPSVGVGERQLRACDVAITCLPFDRTPTSEGFRRPAPAQHGQAPKTRTGSSA